LIDKAFALEIGQTHAAGFGKVFSQDEIAMTGSLKAKIQDSKSNWLRDAKWGFFNHFLPHMASRPKPIMTREQWNKKVNSFQVKPFADQLSSLKVPYFFITVGQAGHYFCSPNKAFDRLFGVSNGVRTERDLIADIAAELIPRGIRMCVYSPAYGAKRTSEEQDMWLEVFTEWSERWGKSISAWWIDGSATVSYAVYQAYINAFRAGNKGALVSTKLWRTLSNEQILEDYVSGESGFLLAVSDKHYHDYRKGFSETIPLHFLTFLGEFWGIGEPRFPVEIVTGWTQHINNLGGTVSWDCPLKDSGEIPDKVYEQLAVLSRKVNAEAG
jgi:hypothetical protein